MLLGISDDIVKKDGDFMMRIGGINSPLEATRFGETPKIQKKAVEASKNAMTDSYIEQLRTCIHNLKRRVDGSFPAIPRCVFLKCTKHSRENAPCLAGKFFAHPASSAVNTGS